MSHNGIFELSKSSGNSWFQTSWFEKIIIHGKKSAAVTGKLILVTAKHLVWNERMNVRRSLNQL